MTKQLPSLVLAFVFCSVLQLSRAANAALSFDLRAVSGSRVAIIQGPKSVAVNQNSVGGWIDFELYAFVYGSNANANDESIHFFAGNMLSTHVGHGAAGGSMINSGEIAPRVRRGVVPPLDHHAYSDGSVQNLDDDPDLEIGGTGSEWFPDGLRTHPIVGRGDPFRVRNYEGTNPAAEFLLYRFTLPIESFLAQSLSDTTSVHFVRMPGSTYVQWFEDGVGKAISNGGFVINGESVLVYTAQTPEELAAIPEPGAWALGLSGMLGAGWFARRRRRR